MRHASWRRDASIGAGCSVRRRTWKDVAGKNRLRRPGKKRRRPRQDRGGVRHVGRKGARALQEQR